MEVDMRLISLFQALIKAYYPIKPDGWNPLPVQLNTVMLSKIISSSRTSVSLQLSEWAKPRIGEERRKIPANSRSAFSPMSLTGGKTEKQREII